MYHIAPGKNGKMLLVLLLFSRFLRKVNNVSFITKTNQIANEDLIYILCSTNNLNTSQIFRRFKTN